MIFSSLCYLAAAVKLAGATYIGKDFDNDDSDDVSYSNFTLTENRPLVHFTPQKGWMNDPNGLWYDAKEELYHMYFQYNPEDNIWGSPLYWGHAVSDDLTTWEERGIALGPKTNDSAAFSGSAVVDVDNTSGFSMILLTQDKELWQSGLITHLTSNPNTLVTLLMVVTLSSSMRTTLC